MKKNIVFFVTALVLISMLFVTAIYEVGGIKEYYNSNPQISWGYNSNIVIDEKMNKKASDPKDIGISISYSSITYEMSIGAKVSFNLIVRFKMFGSYSENSVVCFAPNKGRRKRKKRIK